MKDWIKGEDYPYWMVERSIMTLKGGYLVGEETPKDAMYRIARRAGDILGMSKVVEPIFNAIWNGWICPSSPVWSNFGTERGLPISCFGISLPDSISGIFSGVSEIAKMSQVGGGSSIFLGNIRERGAKISGGGVSNGVKPFIQPFDTTINIVSQGRTRRGSVAGYLPFSHPDLPEFLRIKTVGDPVQDVFPAVTMKKEDYEKIYNGDTAALQNWSKILESRNATGVPYLHNLENVNNGSTTPPWYGYDTDYEVVSSNLCNEINLPCDDEESFVCCLLSMNLYKWEEWKDTKAVRGAIYLMEAIMQDFIDKSKGVEELDRARRFAERHRALGLGVLGWHSFLQSKSQPFTGFYATNMTKQIMSSIQSKAIRASEKLADKFGNCEVVEQFNLKNGTSYKRRHTSLMAVAPTTSNATIAGGISPGIEPWVSNYFVLGGAKGNFTVKNEELERLLIEKNKNTKEVWDSIRDSSGSVQHLDFLDSEEKQVFLTFGEINQFELVRQAALRQSFIDQGQSLNVKIDPSTDPKEISKLYLLGYELGIKGFYYQRSENNLRGGISTMDAESCVSCSG